jgi:murein DD-endopeptidase MepM/ murein hydrolase activator NlpD
MKQLVIIIVISLLSACSSTPPRTPSVPNNTVSGTPSKQLNLALCPMKVSNSPKTSSGKVQRQSAFACLNNIELLINPAPNSCLSSGFGNKGRKHRGIDYHKRPAGHVIAAGNGIIRTITYRQKDFGNWLIIDHGANVYTAYGHLAKVNHNLRVGMAIKQGQTLGIMGETGNGANGVHLHFEVRKGKVQNPKGWWGLTAVDPFLLASQCR